MRSPIRVLAGSALLGVLATAAPAVAQVPGENALPGSTLAIVKVSSASDLREALGDSQFGRLLADPAMEPLLEDIRTKLDDLNTQLKQRIGVTLKELVETPQGPAWLAVTRAEAEIPVAAILVADAGENAARMDEIMTKGTEQLEKEAGGQSRTEEFQGKTLHIIQPPAEDSPPLVWSSEGSVYFIGVGIDAMKDLLANAGGREDSLAASANYQALGEKLGTDSQVCWYIDIQQAIQLVVQAAAEQGGEAGQAEALLRTLGVDQLKAVGGTVDFATGEFDSVAKTFVYAPGQRSGILRLFQMPPIDATPEPWVPATVASYQTLSWDLDAAYTALGDLVNMFLPGALENVERGLQGPGGETIRFQQDIFGPIGDRVSIIADFAEEGEEIDAQSQRGLVAIALEDEQAFQTTLNKVFAIAGLAPEKRDFQGTTIYDVELPELPAAPGAPQLQLDGNVSIAIAKGYLFATGRAPLLEQILRGGGSSLADDSQFRAVAGKYPGQVSSFTFNRPEEQARAVYNTFKSGQFQQAIEAAGNAGGAGEDMPDLSELIDVTKIPEFSVFAKYLSQGGSYSVMEEDGLTITQFSLPKTGGE
ncbi:hypothetical protein [Tautonia plasticadhaerens]|uniref:DUF3352 domain-containing protein n=1 Tax=Tautonia plasticadhaerens TaxID=2527974 RepID=A0A518H598_9BACT|nr:hypothetical protein [Tautonia plasticadhaerens]QDV36011.1 hypothetical protein ElP_39210 [Tautonia plasticadhaerens]